jgi:hypothetical protein
LRVKQLSRRAARRIAIWSHLVSTLTFPRRKTIQFREKGQFMGKPRYRVIFDLTLAKPTPHDIGLIHCLISRKIEDPAVAAWTLISVEPLEESAAHADGGMRGPNPDGSGFAAAGAGDDGSSVGAPKVSRVCKPSIITKGESEK